MVIKPYFAGLISGIICISVPLTYLMLQKAEYENQIAMLAAEKKSFN